jgi:hypothetical protein
LRKYDGDPRPHEWLEDVLTYFEVHGALHLQEKLKVLTAAQHLEKSARTWWMSIPRDLRPTSFAQFESLLLERFQTVDVLAEAIEKLVALKQSSSLWTPLSKQLL